MHSLWWALLVMAEGVVMVHLLGGLGSMTFRRYIVSRSLWQAMFVILGGSCGELTTLTIALCLISLWGVDAFTHALANLSDTHFPIKLIAGFAMVGLLVYLRRQGVPENEPEWQLAQRMGPRLRSFLNGYLTSVSTGGVGLNLAAYTWLGILPDRLLLIMAIWPLAIVGGVGFWGGALWLAQRYGNLAEWSSHFYRWTLRLVFLVAVYLIGSFIWGLR